MDRKEFIAIGIVVLLIVVGAVSYIARNDREVADENNDFTSVEPKEMSEKKEVYSPSVPLFAELTEPKMERVIENNLTSTARERFFDMFARRSGFSPSTLTVKEGDSVVIDFTAVDGRYDFDIPYLGAYFSPVFKGETKRLLFDIPKGAQGTFVFQCRSACPLSNALEGSLIVVSE